MAQILEFIGNHPFLSVAAASLVGLIVAYEFRNATRGYGEVDAAEAPRLINDGAAVLDLRPRADFDLGHVIGATSVPADRLDGQDLSRHQGRPLIVYDANGAGSGPAASRLAGAGHQVFELKGGIAAWQAAGLPTSRGRKGRK